MSHTSERARATLTGVERFLGADDLIVSKTDVHGLITYANRTFMRIAGYTEFELLGAPHSIVRHPEMPRAAFRLLWDTLESGHEIFAYVINRAKNGDHYWVHAHVTPSFDSARRIIGYHSNRRAPERSAIDKIRPIYAALCEEERQHRDVQRAIAASTELLSSTLKSAGVSYEEFVFSL